MCIQYESPKVDMFGTTATDRVGLVINTVCGLFRVSLQPSGPVFCRVCVT